MFTKEQTRAIATANGVPHHEVCLYCGWADKDVEAGGLWFCPNPRCSGPGGGQGRHVRECRVCRSKDDGEGTLVEWTCIVFDTLHASIEHESPAVGRVTDAGDRTMHPAPENKELPICQTCGQPCVYQGTHP